MLVRNDVPAKDAEDKIHDEERPNDDETDEVDPRPANSHRIVDLNTKHPSHLGA